MMDETTTSGENTPVLLSNPSPGLLVTKVPSVLTFGVGILLFFMPFIDIKCNNMVLQKVNGVQLATGFKINGPGADNSLVGSLENMNRYDRDTTIKNEKRDPNMMALVALCLGVAGLLLALANKKTGSFITAVLAAVALVATMIDVKSKLNSELIDSRQAGRNGVGNSFDDNFLVTVDFTPWFYLAVLSFGAAAFFTYKWLRGK